LGVKLPDASADVVVGSPPCESLSIANHNYNVEKGLILVTRYLEYVDMTKPRLALFEEVVSLAKARDIIEEILRKRGWAYEIKCLSSYGAPQKCRKRVLGWRY